MPLISMVIVMILVFVFIVFPVIGKVASWLHINYNGSDGYWKYWLIGMCIMLCLFAMYIISMALGNFYLIL